MKTIFFTKKKKRKEIKKQKTFPEGTNSSHTYIFDYTVGLKLQVYGTGINRTDSYSMKFSTSKIIRVTSYTLFTQ